MTAAQQSDLDRCLAEQREALAHMRRKPRALDLFCCAGGATKGLQRAGFHVTGVDINPQPRYCGDDFHQADALTFPLDGFDFIWASPPCQAFSTLRALQKGKEYPDLIPATRARLIASGIPFAIENVEGAPLGHTGYLIMLCGTMFGLGTISGNAELRRHRLFETSFSIPLRPGCQHGSGVISVHGDHARDRRRKVITVTGHTPVEPRSQRGVITVSGDKPNSANTPRRTISVAGAGATWDNGPRKTISVTGSTPQTNVVHNRDRATYSIEQAKEAMGIDWMTMKGLSQAVPPAYSEFIGRQVIETLPQRDDRAARLWLNDQVAEEILIRLEAR